MNVHSKGQRLLALLLALVMVVGMVPYTVTGQVDAAIPADQQATAQSLIAAIDALEGKMYSKYVRVNLKATNTTEIATANTTLKGLSGKYIAVANTPITTGGNSYYALNMNRSPAYYKYGMDVVQVIGDQLYGYDPLSALSISYDKTGSETSIAGNKTTYTQSTFPTSSYSARARYFITANNGKYLNISNDNQKVTLQQTKISSTLFADYNVGTVRIIKASASMQRRLFPMHPTWVENVRSSSSSRSAPTVSMYLPCMRLSWKPVAIWKILRMSMKRIVSAASSIR